MTNSPTLLPSVSKTTLRKSAFALALLAAIALFLTNPATAQTFTLLHSFTGAGDGNAPTAGLTIDAHGSLYGTAEEGGPSCSCGTVFKLTPHDSEWAFATLYAFQGGSDGSGPQARVTIGPNGTLYGPTSSGGTGTCGMGEGCGTVFNLAPPVAPVTSARSFWNDTVLYRFAGSLDGANPGYSPVVFDGAGNLYGTTEDGGGAGYGMVYKLTRANGVWTKSVIYNFTGMQDGKHPYGGVTFDTSGNLYGTTESGGADGLGTVFQLTPAGSGWQENTLHSFSGGNDGAFPWGGLIFDSAGNFYGTTSGGDDGSGTAFEFTPSNGSWTYSVIHNFAGSEGQSPVDSLILDANGNLYGTALNGGSHGFGSAFKLARFEGSWTYVSLHDFDGNDGSSPFGGLVFDSSGNLYGTTFSGGAKGEGVVFEVAL